MTSDWIWLLAIIHVYKITVTLSILTYGGMIVWRLPEGAI